MGPQRAPSVCWGRAWLLQEWFQKPQGQPAAGRRGSHILQGTGPARWWRGSSEAGPWPHALPCTLPATPGDAPAWGGICPWPAFTFFLASLQLPALPTTFLFSVLRASALLLRAPPLPSGQVPPALGAWGGLACRPPTHPPTAPAQSCPLPPARRGARGEGLGPGREGCCRQGRAEDAGGPGAPPSLLVPIRHAHPDGRSLACQPPSLLAC